MAIQIRPSLHLGQNRVLTTLLSGEAVVVDTESFDSLNYIMGMGLEPEVSAHVLKMLKYNSVFVDVGANVGYYTLRATTRLLRHGKVFSFEANPHTYDLLQRSLYANSYLDYPNIVTTNCAVHDREGPLELVFSPRGLGGASIWTPKNAPNVQQVTVRGAKLDNLIPADLVVDVVKIDVEGNEPYVIRGMHGIIARSPNIKIVLEFFEAYFANNSYDQMQFQREIADLGLQMWRVGDGGALILHPLDVPLKGSHYCVLARSLDDYFTREGDMLIEAESLEIRPIYRSSKTPIVQNGRIAYAKERFSHVRDQDDERVLFHGPYISLDPGSYQLRLVGRVEGEFLMRIQYDFGRVVIAAVTLNATTDKTFPFVLQEAAQKFEIAVWRTDASRLIEVDQIVLKQL